MHVNIAKRKYVMPAEVFVGYFDRVGLIINYIFNLFNLNENKCKLMIKSNLCKFNTNHCQVCQFNNSVN